MTRCDTEIGEVTISLDAVRWAKARALFRQLTGRNPTSFDEVCTLAGGIIDAYLGAEGCGNPDAPPGPVRSAV